MGDLFDKYVPDTAFEMKRAYNHITPLNNMNWITSLVNIMEVRAGRAQAHIVALEAAWSRRISKTTCGSLTPLACAGRTAP